MQIKAFKGVAVVSVAEAGILGTIDDVLLDLSQHRIGAVVLHGGLFHGGPVVPWSEIRSVGLDAVMVDQSSAATYDAAPSPQDYGTPFATLRGRQVVSNTGDLVGTLTEAEVDPATGRITGYEITAAEGGGLFRAAPRFTLPPEGITSTGADLLIADAQVVDRVRSAQD